VVFKHFPLSSTCNPVMKKDIHPLACEAALAAEAANKQGKFWSYHDSLFTAEPINDPAGFRAIAEKIGLNLEQFDEYIHSKEAMQKVLRSILIGKNIGIESTPTVFLNGRKVNDLRSGILRFLIDHELEAKGDSTSISH
jgi:protein-disulfide isomerase